MKTVAPRNFNLDISSEFENETWNFRQGVEKLIRHQFQCLLQVVSLKLAEKDPPSQNQHIQLSVPLSGSSSKNVSSGKPFRKEYLLAYLYIEPRLIMIGRFLKCISGFCRLDQGDQSKTIIGFKLKNLQWWANYPIGSIIDALGCICSYCNAKCEFCFRRGSPLERFKNKMLSASEAKTIVRYYDIKKGTGLPVPLHDTGEFLLNPHILDILKQVRIKDPKVMINDLTTNGNLLNADVIAQLADLKPIFLVVSVNSIGRETRSHLMKGKMSEVALESIPLLRKHGIPYIGSIVPWPRTTFEEIEKTIKFLDQNEAYLIRICLPSFSRYSHPEAPFDPQKYWRDLTFLLEKIRLKISTPLLIQPSWYLRQEIKAHVDGVIKNSPAYKLGLRYGDRILRVDQRTIVTRKHAIQELVSLNKKNKKVCITILRNGSEMEFNLKECDSDIEDHYPYKPSGYPADPKTMFGIHFIDGFPMESLLEMARVIAKHPEANQILIFTTELGQNLFYRFIEMIIRSDSLDIPFERIRVTVAEHRYWGGNIVVGDLHVVQDYIDHIEKLQTAGYNPDLVLIPSSFTLGRWRLDVLGNSYLEIERQTGCKVELIETPPVKI